MNKYEMAIVLKPIEEAAAKEEFEKISGIITRFEGSIDKVDEWGKRRLAYEIEKLSEGIYYFVTFLAEPSVPKEIESRVRIRENVLRYLIIRVDE